MNRKQTNSKKGPGQNKSKSKGGTLQGPAGRREGGDASKSKSKSKSKRRKEEEDKVDYNDDDEEDGEDNSNNNSTRSDSNSKSDSAVEGLLSELEGSLVSVSAIGSASRAKVVT